MSGSTTTWYSMQDSFGAYYNTLVDSQDVNVAHLAIHGSFLSKINVTLDHL
jgi:hypothetical protein